MIENLYVLIWRFMPCAFALDRPVSMAQRDAPMPKWLRAGNSFAATIGALKILKVLMAKKAPVVPATPPEAVRTKPLPIPETPFKTIWQVVGTPPAATKGKGEKATAAA
ncbi:hypothetical protein J2X19_004952 [Rhodoferax ferrireducens]|uniref:Uncharacterized protein n=1 Tax=Rhodoferax ferrireducens TaxID=192843 RepID=A0ABU2CFZ9_9BURK|nr:hypothetical protein [Rhodoferax ferrireducens]MDR7380250.1 hypothetical protein [Rhodoferax ferrireducens]